MTFTYESNDQLKSELKHFFKENHIKQKDISEKLGILPQKITNTLGKKSFWFEDIDKILSAVGYSLVLSFEPKSKPAIEPEPKLSPDDQLMQYLYKINGRTWQPKRKPVMSDEEYNSLKFPWEK